MIMLKSDIEEFEKSAIYNFIFLEENYGFSYIGVAAAQEDPRDSYVSARYRLGDLRVDIVWNPVAMSLGILIKLNMGNLSGKERYIYFEPFVEFISKGLVEPIVPQIYPCMSLGEIKKSMAQRAKCFENGVPHIIESLAKKFKGYYCLLEVVPITVIRQYHAWYLAR